MQTALKATPEDRFWPKVKKTDTCWLWIASIDAYGYGHFGVGGRIVTAHRWVYEHCIGEISEGLEIDHLCRVRHCVNPSHLEAVTKTENTRRGDSPSAKAGRQTHCVHGHPFDERNTYRGIKGRRACRTCNRNAVRRYKQRAMATA